MALVSSIINGITVEPMVFIYYLLVAISGFAGNNLILQKACHPNLTSEPDYDLACPDEGAAQKVVASINSWKVGLENLVPLCFIIFLGTWSDTHGKRRKPLLFIPVTGEFARLLAVMVCVYYWQISPAITAGVESVLRGITGGVTCFSFGTNTYISDISTVENRTIRLGIISALAFVGTPIGTMLGGTLRKQVGFFKLYVICLVINVVTVILGAYFMKNTACVDSKLKTFEGVCDPSYFVQSVKTVFRKRSGNKRLYLLLMGAVAPLYIACFVGEYSVMYLFLRLKFQMDEIEYGNFCAFKMISIVFGSFVALMIFSKVLKMSDALIGCISSFTQIASAIGMCVSKYKWQLYFFSVVDLMHGSTMTTSKSIMSKNVDSSEFGKVFSVICVVDVLSPIVVIPLYNILYKYTLSFMPGAFYILSVFLAVVYFVLFGVVFACEKQQQKLEEKKDTEPIICSRLNA